MMKAPPGLLPAVGDGAHDRVGKPDQERVDAGGGT
jgi:hypothetical protein